LSQSSIKIYQTLAAGNLAMSLETMERRKIVMGWMNISLTKAFRIWKKMVEHDNHRRESDIEKKLHHEMYLKRKFLSAWRTCVLKRRAGSIALGRWIKRATTDKLRRKLDIWHTMTVQHHKRKVMCVDTLFGISRKHELRHAWAVFRKEVEERRKVQSEEVLRGMFQASKEELLLEHNREKRRIMDIGVKRGKIIHLIQELYLKALRGGIGRWARHTIGVRRSTREAERFRRKHRHMPLQFELDR